MTDRLPNKKLGYAALGLLVLVAAAVLVVRPRRDPAVAAKSSRFEAGARVSLVGPDGRGDIPLAVDRQSFAMLRRSRMSSGGSGAFTGLKKGGKVFVVASGTPGVIVEPGVSQSRVRIEGGPRKGSTGWVEDGFLAPSGEPSGDARR